MRKAARPSEDAHKEGALRSASPTIGTAFINYGSLPSRSRPLLARTSVGYDPTFPYQTSANEPESNRHYLERSRAIHGAPRWIRTTDPKVMSLVRCRTALSRVKTFSGERYRIRTYASRAKRFTVSPEKPLTDTRPQLNILSNTIGGSGGIRTHGRFPVAGFQDRSFRPLSHTSPS